MVSIDTEFTHVLELSGARFEMKNWTVFL